MIGGGTALLGLEQGFPITIIGFPSLSISVLSHTHLLSFLHRHPESLRPVTSAPTIFSNPYSHINVIFSQ